MISHSQVPPYVAEIVYDAYDGKNASIKQDGVGDDHETEPCSICRHKGSRYSVWHYGQCFQTVKGTKKEKAEVNNLISAYGME
ncbi:hypothetical protein EVAR_101117_1 [Eumeta japonica]|uniref:Uncharacterized protein n=1 Tax=Eumeta variegata TaxID=151549 RepID=A0A4C1SGB5_EUMVA|nr:hypothetical protein EVAR_101117_1 [Eumeta japonica]